MMELTLWKLRSWRRALPRRMEEWWDRQAAWRRFCRSFQQYRRIASPGEEVKLYYLFPCLGDDTAQTPIEPTYFYQDAWAFERIVAVCPPQHVDVGSHHKFVSLLSKVVPTTMVDIRPLSLPLESIRFIEGTLLSLPFDSGSVPSVSSLCVVEHVGLGRYGDPLDPQGSEKAIAELKRIVAPGGDLYISLPLHNSNRAYFNAHRTFTEDYLSRLFDPFEPIDAAYIYGNEFVRQRRSGFGTACYHLRRPQP